MIGKEIEILKDLLLARNSLTIYIRGCIHVYIFNNLKQVFHLTDAVPIKATITKDLKFRKKELIVC